MATLKLSSPSEDFSYIIKKNPASGMVAKQVRQGTAFGWFPEEQSYCVAFFDAMDEVSFPKRQNEPFAYIDSTKYNAPLFMATGIREFFHSAMNSRDEKDIGVSGYNILEISSIEIHRVDLFYKIADCFPGFGIKIQELPHQEVEGVEYSNHYLMIVTHKPIYELLNLAYLLSHLIAICSHIDFRVESGMLDKLISTVNLLDAPYYVRHLIRCWCIHSDEIFMKVRESLNASKEHKMDISPNINMVVRLNWIKSQIPNDTDVVDYGCGEGNFFAISTRISNSTYYAIDRDEEARDAAQRRIDRKMYENIILLDSLDSFLSAETGKDFIVIMSEMFEHNELKDITKDLKTLMSNPNCSRIILTTPNKDFNKFYLLDEDELRLEDHKFEMTKDEATEYFNDLVKGTEFSVKITDLGDKVDDIPTIIGVILRKTIKGDN